MKWGSILAEKLESERSKRSAVSISLQTKAISSDFRVPGQKNIPEDPGIQAEVGSVTRRARRSRLPYKCQSKVWLYFSTEAQK